LGTAGLLLLLALLRPVDAHPAADEPTIIPDQFVYLPRVAREPTPTPTSTPGPTPIPQVDLVIWDILIVPSDPAPGEQFNITVTAKNVGPDDADVVTYIRLKVGLFDLETTPPKPPLAAGATTDATWAFTLGAGPYVARAEVDPRDIVPETNEGNNVLTQPFDVQ